MRSCAGLIKRPTHYASAIDFFNIFHHQMRLSKLAGTGDVRIRANVIPSSMVHVKNRKRKDYWGAAALVSVRRQHTDSFPSLCGPQ